MFKQKILLAIVACVFLNGCLGIKNNNGYMPVSEKVDQLKVNITSSSLVKSKLGEPALILGNQEPLFIYSSQVTNRFMFFAPRVISRDILVLYFNKKKKLKKIEKYNLNDGKKFNLNTAATNLNARDRSLFATLFSNIGIGGVRIPD